MRKRSITIYHLAVENVDTLVTPPVSIVYVGLPKSTHIYSVPLEWTPTLRFVENLAKPYLNNRCANKLVVNPNETELLEGA